MPKARALSDLIEEYEGPLTADFQRVYGLRLSTVVVDRTETEILDLIEWLPESSALHASIEAEGDEAQAHRLYGWSQNHEIGLGTLNLVNRLNYVLEQVNSKNTIKPPEVVEGPRSRVAKVDPARDANVLARAFLDAQKGS